MKLPIQPPDLAAISARHPELQEAMFDSAMGRASEKRGRKPLYLHWDELIHRPTPKGINHEQWWWLLKSRRSARKIPLVDKAGRAFQFVDTEPIPERLHLIDLSVGGNVLAPDLRNQIITPETRDRYHVQSIIEEAITSSQIEGAATTRVVAQEMIRTGRPPHDRSEKMILNNYRTMKKIGEVKHEPLSKDLIFELHRIVTEETLADPATSGRFRKPSERIFVGDLATPTVVHEPPPAGELKKRMEMMCRFANGKEPADEFIHPVIRAIILHFWLAYDHPFVDGNGRTARALFYWSMLHNDPSYWIFEFTSISQIILQAPAKYVRAFLYTETDDNDLTYFILYQLDVIDRAIRKLGEYVKRKTEELREIESRLRGFPLLNSRQQALMIHALKHPKHFYTVQGHQLSHDVAYESARTDLLNLEERGLLKKRKIRRAWSFTPSNNLSEKLANLK